MKSIRISDESYKFLNELSKKEKRSLIATLDLFVEMFRGENNDEMAEKSLSSTDTTKIKNK